MSDQNSRTTLLAPQMWGFVLLAALGPSLSIFVPRIMAIVPPFAALLAISGLWLAQHRLPRMNMRAWLGAGLVVALCAVSSLWAPDPAFVLDSTARMAGAVVSGLLLIFAANELNELQRRRLCNILVGGFLFALLFICLNEITQSALLVPFLSEHELSELPQRSNRGMVVLSVMLWPTLFAAQTIASTRIDWRGAIFLVPLTFLASLVTDSQTASAAILLSSVIFIATQLRPVPTRLFLMWGGAIFILALPFMILLLRAYDPAINFDWKAASAGARLEIWYAVSAQIIHAPIIGHGMEAARYVSDWGMVHLYYPFDTILHPHNGVLQIWYEFGLVGAAVTAFAWFMLVRRSGFMLSNTQAITLALLVTVALVSTVSHGLWQSWWLGAIALSPALLRIVRQA